MRLAKSHLQPRSALPPDLQVMEIMPKRRQLMILSYHRIGDAAQTPYDSGLFSATAEEFDAQITYVKRRFHVTNLEEALGIVRGDTSAGTSVLITFDDGYLDNYTLAFPILRSHKVQAAFFLPTAFIGTGELPWWDTIAFIVKQSRKKVIELRYPEAARLHLKRESLPQAIIGILQLYKRHSMQQRERFISELESSCESSRPQNTSQRCFLNWDEAREMQRVIIAFGSHTHTHEILSSFHLTGRCGSATVREIWKTS
jgi:peptidoglycan/xylan/chitin deacetylase (PgdA/CDA1 family)